MKTFKNKIYTLIAGLVIAVLVVFGYAFGLFDSGNSALADQVLNQRKTLLELQAEQRSFEQGKKALDELLAKPYQPENFFSSDTSLVQEIKAIERMSTELGIEVVLSVSGTVKTATRAKTIGEVYTIPVILRVQGGFSQAVQFMEKLEHANFPLTITSVGLGGSGGGDVDATLNGSFYVKK